MPRLTASFVATNADSVPSYSPLILKTRDGIEIISIEDLWDQIDGKTWKTTKGEAKKVLEGISVFRGIDAHYNGKHTFRHWDKVKKIFRHYYTGELVILRAPGGIVEVTPNHSIIIENKKRKADEVKIGEKLTLPRVKLGMAEGPTNGKCFFVGTEALAWLYGFFVAEGNMGSAKTKKGNTYHVTFSNLNRSLLNNIEEAGLIELNCKFTTYFNGGIYRCQTNNKGLYNYFKSIFYTSEGEKKIPTIILNSPKNIKKAFFEGYYVGDGRQNPGTSMFDFCTKSPVLATGLIWLISSIYDVDFTVSLRKDKLNITTVRILKGGGKNKKDRRKILNIYNKKYVGYVYDLAVGAPHRFMTGVPAVYVMNTVDGIHAETTPTANFLLALNDDAVFNVFLIYPLTLAVGKTINILADNGAIVPETFAVSGTLNVTGIFKVID